MLQLEMEFILNNFGEKKDNSYATEQTLSPEQKALIVRELLKKKIHISSLAEKYDVHPNEIYTWEKALFEGTVDISLKVKRKPRTHRLIKMWKSLKKLFSIVTKLTANSFERISP